MTSETEEPPLCACGCGEPTRWYPRTGWKKYRRGHNTRIVGEGSASRHRHGMSCTPTWYSWSNMISRCTKEYNPAYPRYGGRGITVCERWSGKDGFQNFLTDMGEKPDGLTLERIDNNTGYFPHNCRWASRKEQAANTRHINLLDIDVEWVRAHPEKSRKELAQALDVSEVTISNIRNRKGRFSGPS